MDGDAAVSLARNVDSFASHQNGVALVSSTPIVGSLGSDMLRPTIALSTATACITNDISRATISSRHEFKESFESRDMQNSSTEVKQNFTLKARSAASTLAPIKDLIAAAQAKRFLSRSTSFCDNVIDDKVAPDAVVSPSLISKEDSSGHISPSNPVLNRRPSSDDGTCYLQNGNRTPFGFSSVKGSKYMNHAEANAARRSFESLLCTLSRTKESIGRATRLAIDCAKCGIAGEVIDMLLHNLEKEPRLHRRIDLFFLVDSITQFSRCQRGGPGDVYPSLVQVVLPRLLSAAAPPGNAASENRRQCLKVLRLWLERRTLPEFIVRHHLRELEYGGEASLINSYSRRPPRTERALNDPVREMEGMLVDEYGSNASFQLPQLFNTRVTEDDAGSASEEKGFESVTPDRSAEVDNEKAVTPKTSEKHRLILEDVDGELEMEDVAPPCGHDVVSSCFVGGVNGVKSSSNICKNNAFSFAPPLPEDRPPSPPPLPSSPDPISQPFPISSMDQNHHPSCDKAEFYPSGAIQPAENQLPQTLSQLPNVLRVVSSSLTESGPSYYGQGYAHPQQMPALVSSGASSGLYDNLSGTQLAMPPGNISQPIVNAPLASKVYALQPPVPVVSNQFSYLQAQPPKRQEAWGNHSSCTDRFDHAFYNQRDKFYRDGVPTGPIPPDVSNRAEIYPTNHSGHRVLEPDKMEAPPVPPFHGPQLEASSASCQIWSNRPRQFAYPGAAPRPSLENPDFRLTGAPTYWRAR
ncbi:hypothetical protein HPP92_011884 [Vanilla planifolia]|uniref:CID domain-containing protein n=1 Tax=Vanilla planifolia TaxID=51239 RepID=A0A835QWJ0_VANPL|nr:hypothetical protein HPP92_011884 [Vanilla planifolia]